jgi:hypothetical protein
MFGNHPLPNIHPSHLFYLPPPSHHLAVIAVPAVPLMSAQMGQARAFWSTPTTMSPLLPTVYATSLLTVSPKHHLTTTIDTQMPRHHHYQPQQPPMTSSRHVTTVDDPLHAMSPLTTTTRCHITANDSRTCHLTATNM